MGDPCGERRLRRLCSLGVSVNTVKSHIRPIYQSSASPPDATRSGRPNNASSSPETRPLHHIKVTCPQPDTGTVAEPGHRPVWGLDRKPRRIRAAPTPRFRIVGSLSEHARAAFPGMDVTAVPAETVISGQVDDDGVQQVLALIQSLGLKIVSVRRANGARKAREHSSSPGLRCELPP